MTADELNRLRAIAEQATPGPWYSDGYRLHGPTADADKRNGPVLAEWKHCEDVGQFDGDHIAAFDPPTVLKLIEAAERLAAVEAERDRYKAALANIACQHAGPIVDASFDSPWTALAARTALESHSDA